MTRRDLALRGFRYYLPSNAATIAGAAVATAVITGALLVGASVRLSLRDLALAKLGKTEWVVARPGYFREELAAELGGAPLIQIDGVVTRQADNRRASGVQIYGVDERFWAFHGVEGRTPAPREVAFSAALAAEIEAQPGGAILLHVEKLSAIPRESLHGRREDAGKTIRLTVASTGMVVDAAHMGEFAIRPQQGPTRAAFVNLKTLQRELAASGRVNTVLLDAAHRPDAGRISSENRLRPVRLADLGISLRPAADFVSVQTDSAVIPKVLEDVVAKVAPQSAPFLTYLVNKLTSGSRSVPYSLVTAVGPPQMDVGKSTIVVNEWAAKDLGLSSGDAGKTEIRAEYYYWDPQGTLTTQSASFRLARIIPTVDDRTLAPEYPGITDSESLQGWDPPFPMNLKLVRPIDEDYWKRYRTTPKAFISLEDGRRLWGSRFGGATMVRAYGVGADALGAKLRQEIRPEDFGLSSTDVRAASLSASAGSTDFGEYFLYFSFFLVGSALLLLVLFFQFGMEQRVREIGMLRAVGFTAKSAGRLFLADGTLIALAGSLTGVALAVVYAALILYALRTVWRGAVGTSALTLHITGDALLTGWAAGVFFSILTMWLTLRRLRKVSPRQLLSGSPESGFETKPGWWSKGIAGIGLVGGILLVGLGLGRQIGQGEAFFGGATLLLMAAIAGASIWLKGGRWGRLSSPAMLGLRNSAWKPGRSALAIGLIASATFLLVSLESFRNHAAGQGLGGFSIVGESQVPIVYDPNTAQGRDALGLSNRSELAGLRFYPFRLKGGDDTSCLNLYEPRNPRILGARADFLSAGRFGFDWKLLDQPGTNGAIPAVGDRNSVEYVLHKVVGDEIELTGGGRLRLVGLLDGSLMQSELIVSEQNFKRLFPSEQGFRFFLIEGPVSVIGPLEDVLSDFGFDATDAAKRLEGYQQVENTYLSTFQLLGGLGLLLGTVGLSAVLLRNTLERGREIGLLRAVGFRATDLSTMVLFENLAIAVIGVFLGLFTALVAIAPGLIGEQRQAPGWAVVVLVALVPVVALAASGAAIRSMHRRNLLESLRSGL